MDERVLAKVLIVGNIGSGKSTFAHALGTALGWRRYGIDEARQAHGDGSPAGEARAWAAFLERAESDSSILLECTGAGPFMDLLRLALRRSGHAWTLLWVDTPPEECLRRVERRGLAIPYPDFGVPISQVIPGVARNLARALEESWPRPLHRVEGLGPVEQEVARAVQVLSGWLTRDGRP
ncbi:hypothetical protein JRI60_17425 [Archangium violaceum]|jgi:hypothetical protein|uniref:AAA family ATPase n=1 Tax=Archangium violaceum TaxID=83451 RepID=UPI0019513454|nr:AAA family ATPase [Archangium violaceum]QRO00680.1 hypothetical protein JRI60_17425 [Archangium violaceum]